MIINTIQKVNGVFSSIPESIIGLVARVAAATPFWLSARNKVNGWDIWNVTDSTVFLFEYEYALPVVSPQLAATMASLGEHILPVLLVLGLLTRLGALGLIGMTLVIQTLVYPDAWSVHILWFAPLLYLLARGPGAISLDRLLGFEKA